MPPRLDLLSALRFPSRSSHISFTCLSRSSKIPAANASTVAQRRRRQDPYEVAQAKARKQANISRQEVLRAEKIKARGDPVRGLTTPFVQSFDTARPNSDTPDHKETIDPSRNFFLSAAEIDYSIENSKAILAPPDVAESVRGSTDPAVENEKAKKHEREHSIAAEAVARITSMDHASGADLSRINKQRCIEAFGRHNTDQHLKPKPPSNHPRNPDIPPNEKTPRAGPDTGSSEVQIALLTAKIRAIANTIEARGNKDHQNKRALRLLVHKRQKLLKYLRRKERGGERWQHCIKTLGLTEGTWNGEITL